MMASTEKLECTGYLVDRIDLFKRIDRFAEYGSLLLVIVIRRDFYNIYGILCSDTGLKAENSGK